MKRKFGARAQVARLTEQIERAQRDREHILDAIKRYESETDDAMTKRLRAYRTKQGFREARFRLTKKRAKQAQPGELSLRLLLFINAKQKRARAGFDGAALRIEDMAKALKVCERQIYRVLAKLEQKELVIRLRKAGDASRYAVTVPETNSYQEALSLVFEMRAERMREELECERCYLEAAA